MKTRRATGAKTRRTTGGTPDVEPTPVTIPGTPLARVYTVAGRYEVRSTLSRTRGGADVLFGEDRNFASRRVALKKGTVADPSLQREAELLGQLSHPGLPRLYDDITAGNWRYLVMEYVDRPVLEPGRLDVGCVLDIGVHLLEILRYLHELPQPVVHADVKPANLLVDLKTRHVTLLDFGASARIGQDSMDRATPGYAPAEQRSKGTPRTAWDVYAACVTLHQLLSGLEPAKWSGRAAPALTGVTPELQELLARGLRANPKERLSCALSLQVALERIRSLVQDYTRCPCGYIELNGVFFCHRCGHQLVAAPKAGKKKVVVEHVGQDALLAALEGGRPTSEQVIRLRNDVQALARPLSYEVLMSVDHLPFESLPHQLKAARSALKLKTRVLLADEVGLGKTIEAGIIREELKVRGHLTSTLILVPPSLREQWRDEMLEKFSERFECYDATTRDDIRIEKVQNLIISLDTAVGKGRSRVRGTLEGRRWDLVIVDEAHHAKSHTSERWKLLSGLKCNFLLLLTATPLQNKLEELFNLVSILQPGLLGINRRDFQERYEVDGRTAGNADQLRRDLEKVMLRTRRSQAYVRFPERTAYTKLVETTPVERTLYDGVTNLVRRLAEEAQALSPKEAATWKLSLIFLQQRVTSSPSAVLDSLKRMAIKFNQHGAPIGKLADQASRLQSSWSKAAALAELVDQAGDKVVVFTDHVATQLMLRDYLRSAGYPTCVFRGSAEEKQRALRSFAENARVMIVSASGAEGLNLHRHCHIVVNYDLPWNPMRVEQRIGRVQRLGQTRDVLVFNLAFANTVEEHVLRVLREKIHLFEVAIGQVDLILGDAMSDEDDFQDRVWRCLLKAKTRPELERLLNREFEQEEQNYEAMLEDQVESLFHAF